MAAKLSVTLISKQGGHNSGVGRYARELEEHLRDAGVVTQKGKPVVPAIPGFVFAALNKAHIDLKTFLDHYPIKARYPRANIYHLTAQNLGTLLLFNRPRGKVVLTAHDIIPFALRHSSEIQVYKHAAQRLADYLAVFGLRRADALIADSEYTRQSLITHLRYSARRIAVVPLAVDKKVFRPQPVPADFFRRYGLSSGKKYILYVGSLDPRKNFERLLRAFAQVAQTQDQAPVLLSVGEAHDKAEQARLVALAGELGGGGLMQMVGAVTEADLALFYNLATVSVQPSLYEGFGLTALEAFSCGAPLIAANIPALSEITGAAAMMVDPRDVGSIAAALEKALNNQQALDQMVIKGLELAARYSWDRVAAQTLQVYQAVLRKQTTKS